MDMGRVGRGLCVGDAERESMAGVEGALEPESAKNKQTHEASRDD